MSETGRAGWMSGWLRAAIVVPVLIGVLAFGLRVAQSGTLTVTTDEQFWLIRADGFRAAVANGDLGNATAARQVKGLDNATMPGVTVMLAANAGRGLAHLGSVIGVNDPPATRSVRSASVLRAARGVVAATSAVLIGLIVALGWSLFGRVAATTAGLLLATEPWFVGLGNVVHTDQLVTLFSAVSLLGLAWVLGLHRPNRAPPVDEQPVVEPPARPTPRAGLLVMSGVCAGSAVLTKLSALALVVPGAVIIVLASDLPGALRRLRTASGWSSSIRRWFRLGAWWTVGALGIFVAAWPALWVAPGGAVGDLIDSAGLAGEGHLQFFLGSTTRAPGFGYYAVAWPFRMSPWLLIGAAAVVVACIVQPVQWWRATRTTPTTARRSPVGWIPLWLVLVGVPYALTISVAAKKLDRYVTPLFPYLALAVGLVVARLAAAAVRVRPVASPRHFGAVAGVTAAVIFGAVTLAQAPFAISHVNPLLGGQRVAERTILLGWSEGRVAMGEAVAQREAGNCDRIDVVMIGADLDMMVPCGNPVQMDQLVFHTDPGNYLVTTIDQEQRLGPALHEVLPDLRVTLVDDLRIGGVAYARLWRFE